VQRAMAWPFAAIRLRELKRRLGVTLPQAAQPLDRAAAPAYGSGLGPLPHTTTRRLSAPFQMGQMQPVDRRRWLRTRRSSARHVAMGEASPRGAVGGGPHLSPEAALVA
jgi:hypothetical protein